MDALSDVLSQSTAEADAESVLPRKPVGLNMPQEAVDKMRVEWGFDPIVRASEPFHQHPFLAVARKVLERDAAKAAKLDHDSYRRSVPTTTARIVAVAPNVGREHVLYNYEYYLTEVHNQIPMVHPNDMGRRSTARQLGLRNWCDHLAGDCNCVVPSVYTGTHVLYYIKEDVLVRMLTTARLHRGYFVVMLHDGIYGARKGVETNDREDHESKWWLDGEGNVHERVKGNLTDYCHPPLSWVLRGGFNAGPEHCVVVERLKTLGETLLVRVDLVAGQRPAPPPRVADSLFFRLGLAGPDPGVSDFQDTNDVELRRVQVHAYAVLGDAAVLRVETGLRGVVVSRAAIAKVSSHVAGRARDDPALWDDARHYARGVMLKQRMPPVVVERALNYTAALGVVAGVREEVDIMLTIRENYTSLFRLHSMAVRFGSVRIVGLGVLGSAAAASLLLWAASFAVPTYHHAVAAAVGAGLVSMWIGFCCCLLARNRHMARVGASWTRFASRGTPPGVDGPVALTVPLLDGHRELADPPPLRADALISVQERERRRHPAVVVPRSEAVGMMVPDHVPLVIEPTVEAEEAGVRGRILKRNPLMPGDNWKLLLEQLESSDRFAPVRELHFEQPPGLWTRWLAGRSEAEKARLEKARQSLRADPVLHPEDMLADAFVKMEKTLGTVKREGAEAKTPRIIQAARDRFKATVGPTVWWCCGLIKKAFDGTTGTLFASGRNADQVGGCVQRAWEAMEHPRALIADQERYDSHCGIGYKQVLGCVFWWMGMTQTVLYYVLSSVPDGITVHGVRYSTEDGLRSGAQETSDGGSLYNATCHAATFVIMCIRWHFDVVLGDDLVSVYDAKSTVDDATVAAEYKRIQTQMWGLSPDPHVVSDPSQLKFASHIFVPMDDGKWRLSPMPGRVVAKLGSKMTGTQHSNLAADVNSVWQDAAHVPILNTYLLAYKRLLKGVAPKGRPEDWEYKVHAPYAGRAGPKSWTYMRARYDLGPEDDLELKRYLDTVTSLPCVVSHRVLTRLMEVDVA